VYGNFALLIPSWREGFFPYLPDYMARVPHHMVDLAQIPDLTANDVFYITHLLRGKVESHVVTGRALALRKGYSELFDPTRAVKLSASQIDYRLRKVFGTVPKWQRYGEAWQRNSEILLKGWGGDILNVFDGVTTEAEVRDRVMNKQNYKLPFAERGFYMFQAKMTALLVINLMQAGFIPRISMSFPVDFHHLRALIGTGMIQLENGIYNPEPLVAAGDRIGRVYLDRFPGMDPVVFSELLFVLSREGCANAVDDSEADWDDPAIQRRYQMNCGRCPLEHRCQQTAVSSEYYRKDGGRRVIKIVSRPKPPRRIRLHQT
jgi:hypothetical protein